MKTCSPMSLQTGNPSIMRTSFHTVDPEVITCYRLEKALKACALFREYSACSICCFCNKKSKTKERIKKQTDRRQSSLSSTRIRTSIWRSCPNQRVAHEHYNNVFIHLTCVRASKRNTLSQTPFQTPRLHSEKIRQNLCPHDGYTLAVRGRE